MIPTRIYLKNFMNHIESDIDVTGFDSALIVAKGATDDGESNGLGKTTIFSGIIYALFGEVPTSVLEKVIKEGQTECSVEFEFILDDIKYKIERSRSKSKSGLKFWEEINNEWVDRSGRPTETDKKIADLIKINYKSFFHSINFSQYDLKGLVSAKTPAEREAILKEPLSVAIYPKLEKLAKDNRSKLKKEIDQIIGSISILGNPKENIKIAKEECKHYKLLLTQKKDEISNISNIIDEKNKEYNNLKNILSDSDSHVHEELASLSKKIDGISLNIKRYETKVLDVEVKKDNLIKEISIINKQLDDSNAKYNELSLIELEDVADLKAKLDKTQSDEVFGAGLLAKTESEYDQANQSIPKDDTCSLCKQNITKKYRLEFEEKISKILEEKSALISNIKRNLTKCRNLKSKLKERISYIENIQNKKDNLNRSIKGLESELEKDKSYLDKYVLDISAYNTDLSKYISEFNTINSNIKMLKESIADSKVSDVNSKMLKVSEEIKMYERNLKESNNDVVNIKAKESAALENIRISEANFLKIKELKEKNDANNRRLKIYNVVVNGFSSSGITRFLIYFILNDLQFETNKALSMMRDYIQIEFDDNLNMVYKVHDMVREADQISIGQKVYVAFAFKIGLSKVIQKNLGINLQFMLLDEVDQPLDRSGTEAYADIIKKLQKELKCFVITHNDLLKDKFTHAILVEGSVETGVKAKVTTNW